MKSAFQKREPRYPERWELLPAGDIIKQAVQDVCDDYGQRIFGYHFVKLGNLSSQITLSKCPISHQINQTASSYSWSGLVGKSHQLPYSENSVDGFLLANELDFAQDPHQILREVDRVITQSGYVIISGFNPLSLTGIGKYLPFKRGNILHDARFFTSSRIKDWLQLLGFEIIEQRQVLFSMLFFNYSRKHPSKLQKWLSDYCPWCSSVYIILAKKRVYPMTTIRPKWKLQPQFNPVGASMREGSFSSVVKPECD
ncbi:methyltransferase domain-containing protein [Alteromonas sp. ASW11-130]|uniref:methyltransferase domain-containing protein n=1 Tax=Alteromonas sp. ASW11-130 TaxID=3015775 RepID=UPI002241E483|nr:methyltransferase domain-containing protein [Alteromonas sp. ASW11-130]MCW8092768.1 class I SAM-dependent methyltransferase [Alteromonas sp. ASW11-130]